MLTPEGRVKADIKAYLKEIGAWHFWPVQTGYGAATVDCLACIRGEFWAIEVKRPGGKPTKRQQMTLSEISMTGGWAACVDSVDALRARVEAGFVCLI